MEDPKEISELVDKLLRQAHREIEAENYEEAQMIVEKLLSANSLTQYERRTVEVFVIKTALREKIATAEYLPIVRVAPVYPARALARGLEGYVDMSFTVTTAGTVKDPIVSFSTSTSFDRAALRAVLLYKYKPRVVDGVPVEVPNVKTRISFKIQE